jgi:hypothetical protein
VVYVYSLIAHMERILAGLVQLADAENVAASAPVCRHVFEWTALSCYLTGNLRGRFKQNDWEEAWELLTKVALGSRWMKEHGSKYAGNQSLKIPPEPVYIPVAVREYKNYQSHNSREAEARDTYSFLCDHANATAACLMPYRQMEENGVVMRFPGCALNPDRESFLPFVNCCLIDLLTFGYELLGLANESAVRPKVRLALRRMAQVAPARLTGSLPP